MTNNIRYYLKIFSFGVLVSASALFLSSCSELKKMDNYFKNLPVTEIKFIGQKSTRNVVNKVRSKKSLPAIKNTYKRYFKTKKHNGNKSCSYIVRDLSRHASKVWCRPAK